MFLSSRLFHEQLIHLLVDRVTALAPAAKARAWCTNKNYVAAFFGGTKTVEIVSSEHYLAVSFKGQGTFLVYQQTSLPVAEGSNTGAVRVQPRA